MVVETHAVDDRTRFGQAEHPWPRVAGLRPGRDGADFEETEAQCGQGVDVVAVFIEACSQPDRIRDLDAHDAAGHRRNAGQAWTQHTGARGDLQRLQRQVMGGFGIQREQQGAEQGIHAPIVLTSPRCGGRKIIYLNQMVI